VLWRRVRSHSSTANWMAVRLRVTTSKCGPGVVRPIDVEGVVDRVQHVLDRQDSEHRHPPACP
jgi:hypothetical protein